MKYTKANAQDVVQVKLSVNGTTWLEIFSADSTGDRVQSSISRITSISCATHVYLLFELYRQGIGPDCDAGIDSLALATTC